MKVLLTGMPRTGKSKLIRSLAESFPGNAGGILVAEICGQDGRRRGYELQVVWSGPGQPLTVVERMVLAHVDQWFPVRVGRYRVNPQAIALAVKALDSAMHEGGLVVIDEIGPLQVHSPDYRDAVLRCLLNPGQLIGSISMAEDPFLQELRAHPTLRLVEVNRQNSRHLEDGLRRWLCTV